MVLMLVSTACAFPFCGCGFGCGDHSGDHSCNDKSSDESSNKCIVCPACPACNCPTCDAPALFITKTANASTYNCESQVIQYNYTLTNTGNGGLNGTVIYDNITSPTGMPVTTITTLDPGGSVTVNTTYIITPADITACSVTNSAYATAFGGLMHIISNTVTQTIYYVPPPT